MTPPKPRDAHEYRSRPQKKSPVQVRLAARILSLRRRRETPGDGGDDGERDTLLAMLQYNAEHRVGAAPGLSEQAKDEPCELSVIRYDLGHFEEARDCTLEEALRPAPDGCITWIDVVGVRDQRVLKALGERYGLHPLALEDVGDLAQRSKVEDYPTFDFVLLKAIVMRPEPTLEQVSLFLCEGAVITFQQREGDSFEPVRQRLRLAKGRIRGRGADYLAYAIVDAIVDSLHPTLAAFGDTLDALEEEVLSKPVPALLNELHLTRRRLLALRKAAWPLRETVAAFGRESNPRITPETRVFIRDTRDHVLHAADMIETFRDAAGGLVELYMSSISNRMNEVMSLLTVITTIFVPLSFLAGIFGMNFDTRQPGNMPELALPYAYPVALGSMVMIALGLLLFFRRRGWLRWGR